MASRPGNERGVETEQDVCRVPDCSDRKRHSRETSVCLLALVVTVILVSALKVFLVVLFTS